MLELRKPTPSTWTAAVLNDFDAFLLDHAACERKASATGMSFVVRYPDRVEILDEIIAFAREELDHFHQVYRLVQARGLRLPADERDPYVNELQRIVRHKGDARFLDRLLLAAVVEARGCERFGLVAAALPQGELADFYLDITRSEARHQGLFVRLARVYFDEAEIRARLDAMLDHEAQVMEALPIRAALH